MNWILLALTVIDSTVALVPETSIVPLPEVRSTLVVSVTSLYAASASPGKSRATAEPVSKIFFMCVRSDYASNAILLALVRVDEFRVDAGNVSV